MGALITKNEQPEQTILRLTARIQEMEDFQERVEASAAASIEMAEGLAIARMEAEEALKQAHKYQETIQELALFDPLTKLANRNQFHQKFADAIKVAKRDGSMVLLLLFDLDHFKDVNDTFGHPVGDELLKYVANNLIEATRETDTAARLGGDEFAIILTHLDRDERAATIANRVISALSKPITLNGCLINTGTSIGISAYPRDSTDADELIRTADMALYSAKSDGRSEYRFYNDEMNAQAKAAHILDNELRLAIVRNEFILHYQPQLSSSGQNISGVEALVRWQHPVRGLLPPAEFIDAAETGGLIVDIGKLILDEACRQRKAWNVAGMDRFRVAVNISAIQFHEANFITTVEDTLTRHDLDPTLLELEITESAMLEDIEAVTKTLEQLCSLGIDVSIDDFGTGYSSLAYLKRLPIQKLKIDKTFVDNLHTDADDLAIAEAVVRMGHTLGLSVIAEGVESEGQVRALTTKGCDNFQGYLYAKPLAAEALAEWLENLN